MATPTMSPHHTSINITPTTIPLDMDEITDPIDTSTPESEQIIGIARNMTTSITPPYHISLGNEPFDNLVDIEISTCGNHTTLGLQLTSNHDLSNMLQLIDITLSKPLHVYLVGDQRYDLIFHY